VRSAGLVIGRSPECDLVIDHEQVSRRHAHVRQVIGHGGLELVPLGRNPIDVNGALRQHPTPLGDGDRVAIACMALTIHARSANADHAEGWLLASGATWFGIPRLPLVIGGGDHDDLFVEGWPGAALQIHRVRDALFVEADVEGVTVNGAEVEPGAVEPLGDGDALALGDRTLIVRRHAGAGAPTRGIAAYPDRVEVVLLARGARVTLGFGGAEKLLVVSERRVELLAALLEPAPPDRAGEFVADAAILERVWPRSDRADQGDLNALVHRLRRDLVKAGIDGPALVVRRPGATRFALAAGAHVAFTHA
jgi:pSer/pThr/pTyr-binding forkhead associated (FHA) protein